MTDYEELAARADAAGKKFDSLSDRIKQLEGRMAEVAQLKMHIINYSKMGKFTKNTKSPGRKINTVRNMRRRSKNMKRQRQLLTH